MIVASNDRRKTIEYFYRQENEEWHRNIHKNRGTIDENIQSTLDTIAPDSRMYEVFEDGELAAFFVKYKDARIEVIEGFHVAKRFRNSEFLSRFWNAVKTHFEGDIFIGLAEQNQAVIKHCQRQGFKITETFDSKGNLFVILVHRKL